MAHKREHLEGLLKLVEQISSESGNEWFEEELNKRYNTSPNIINEVDKRTKWISEYLRIDIPKEELFDYSYIPSHLVKTRTQLQLDNIEMLRARYGKRTIDGNPDFDEYCRFAHYQIEELFNFFFRVVEAEDLDTVQKHWLDTTANVEVEINDESFYKRGLRLKNGKLSVYYKDLIKNNQLDHKDKYRSRVQYPFHSKSYTEFSSKRNFFVQMFSFRIDLNPDYKMRHHKTITWLMWKRNALSHRNASAENQQEQNQVEYNNFLNQKNFQDVYNCILEVSRIIQNNTPKIVY